MRLLQQQTPPRPGERLRGARGVRRSGSRILFETFLLFVACSRWQHCFMRLLAIASGIAVRMPGLSKKRPASICCAACVHNFHVKQTPTLEITSTSLFRRIHPRIAASACSDLVDTSRDDLAGSKHGVAREHAAAVMRLLQCSVASGLALATKTLSNRVFPPVIGTRSPQGAARSTQQPSWDCRSTWSHNRCGSRNKQTF